MRRGRPAGGGVHARPVRPRHMVLSTPMEELVRQMPYLRVIHCACHWLLPHHPGYVELYYDPPPPPKPDPTPDHKTRRRVCEAAALQRRKRRMLAPWVTMYSPRLVAFTGRV